MYIPIVLTIYSLFQLFLFSSFSSITIRNAMSTSSFIIKFHNSQNSSLNAHPYRVLHNLFVFLLYWRLVKTPVDSPHFLWNVLYEHKEMETFLHYTITYTRAYIGDNICKKKILCIFSFYVFCRIFQHSTLSSHRLILLPADIQMLYAW
jgi:hypothetical protein